MRKLSMDVDLATAKRLIVVFDKLEAMGSPEAILGSDVVRFLRAARSQLREIVQEEESRQ